MLKFAAEFANDVGVEVYVFQDNHEPGFARDGGRNA
jgi:hypothetical protein